MGQVVPSARARGERHWAPARKFGKIHPAVRLRQKNLGVAAMLRTRDCTDTEAEQWFAANRDARIPSHLLQNLHLGGKMRQRGSASSGRRFPLR